MCVHNGCESCFLLLRRLSSSFLREEERGGWGEAYFFTLPLSSPASRLFFLFFLSLSLSLPAASRRARAREEMKFSSPTVLSFVCPRESILHECEIIIIIIIARGTTRGASIEKRGEEMRFDDAKKRPRVASFVLLLLFSRVIISTYSVLTFLLEHTASA